MLSFKKSETYMLTIRLKIDLIAFNDNYIFKKTLFSDICRINNIQVDFYIFSLKVKNPL